jgi:hypothetical protein
LLGLSSLISVTVASVVKSSDATETAFCIATLSTFAGSTIPASNISTYSPVAALNPKFSFEDFSTSFATTPASYPAFKAICFNGALIALKTIAAPICSSP